MLDLYVSTSGELHLIDIREKCCIAITTSKSNILTKCSDAVFSSGDTTFIFLNDNIVLVNRNKLLIKASKTGQEEVGKLLLESGDFLLLETGDKILLNKI